MKNVFKWNSNFILIITLISMNSFSQEFVEWTNLATNSIGITGVSQTTQVGVTATSTGIAQNLRFMPVTFPTRFQTRGPWPNYVGIPADDLIFNFSVPVVITNLILTDMNSSPNQGGWNDSFQFSNNTIFGSVVPQPNTNVTVFGISMPSLNTVVSVTSPTWSCSQPIQTFSINWTLVGNRSTAFVNYQIELVRVPQIDPICLNDIPLDLSTIVVGNNIQGTWNPSAIDTSISGDFIYTFTPNPGQALTCPIPVNVRILPAEDSTCCIPDLILISGLNDVSNAAIFPINERLRHVSNSITATNFVTVGDNVLGNGVIYKAGNFIELNPGFEALFGSQFSAYPEDCLAPFVYRNPNNSTDELTEITNKINSLKTFQEIDIYPNPVNTLLTVKNWNSNITKVSITSLDGRVASERIVNQEVCEIDVSAYAKGLYLITVQTEDGQTIIKKFIKN